MMPSHQGHPHLTWFFTSLAIIFLTFGSLSSHVCAHDLRWGADATSNVPYSFHDLIRPQQLTGFEYELVEAIAQHLNTKPVFIQNDWDGLIPGLARNLYDFVICGIEITPQHAQEVDFSAPYYIAQEQIVTLQGANQPTTLQQLSHHVVGTIKSSQAEVILSKDPTIKIQGYDEESLVFSDLLHGRINAILIDNPIALYYTHASPAFKLSGKAIGSIPYGIAFAKGKNKALVDQINHVLEEMQKNGELHQLLGRWKLWNEATADAFNDHSRPSIQPVSYERYITQEDQIQASHSKLSHYIQMLPLVGKAAMMTLIISLLSMCIAMALGLIFALIRLYGRPLFSRTVACIIEVIRGTPLLIQILFIFYGLPQFGIDLSPFTAGILSLGINYAAYEAENYRTGLQAIPRGQLQAALALNMTRPQALRYVLIPQAFKTVIPVIINDFISLLKDSSLVSMITLTELTQTYIRLSSSYFDYFGIGIIIGLAYLLLGLPFVRLGRYMEDKLALPDKQN